MEQKNLRKCCPDFDCSYAYWDKKNCRSCGADCSKCEWIINALTVEGTDGSLE
jgi:hypothetical protein